MKFIKIIFPLTAMLFLGIMIGCEKDMVQPQGDEQLETRGTLRPATAVNLLSSANFAMLSKSGMTVKGSTINGTIGTSPASGSTMSMSCSQVSGGSIYTSDIGGPMPCRITDAARLTTAVQHMERAYDNAASRTNPNYQELGAGNIGGMTLKPGLYKWTTGVTMSDNVTLTGRSNDVWIFQVDGPLTMASETQMVLSGGARSRNIFWQVTGQTTIGTYSHFEGNILSTSDISMQKGGTIDGRLLTQAAVYMQQNTVDKPQ